jgi:hypothetical protein
MTMRASLHKVALSAELGLLAVPVSALFCVGAAVAIFSSVVSLPQSAGLLALVVMLLLAMMAFWSLVDAYWRRGLLGLEGAHLRLWFLSALGAVYAIVAAVAAMAGLAKDVGASAIQYVFAIYWSGLPMLVPLLHLGLLRLRASANKPMHATREDARA